MKATVHNDVIVGRRIILQESKPPTSIILVNACDKRGDDGCLHGQRREALQEEVGHRCGKGLQIVCLKPHKIKVILGRY